MPYFRVNYEEYLRYDEFIEAADEKEAEEKFKKHIQEFDPVEGDQYDLTVEAIDSRREIKEAK